MLRRKRAQLAAWTLIGILLLLGLLTAPPWSGSTVPQELVSHPFWSYNPELEELQDPEQSCSLARVHPLHPAVWPHLKTTQPIVCKVRQPWLTYVDLDGQLRFNRSSGYELKSLSCSYKPIRRVTDDLLEQGDSLPFVSDPTPLLDDVVAVRCANFLGVPIYSNIHAVIQPLRQDANKLPQEFQAQPPMPNVLVFGLDSVSRLSMMRLLPKSYEFLVNQLGAVVFRGMNKVGDNTFPNLVALLTGRTAYRQLHHPGPNGASFDSFPFIWKDFAEAGYETLFAEDFPEYGLFNYLARGFDRPPTDCYLRPFWLAVEESFLMKSSSSLCFGNVQKHMLQMEYLHRFLDRSKKNGNRPYFAFSFLVEISHEYMHQVAAADDDFVNFLSALKTGGHLDNTFLFFISDHGHRFDSIRQTFVGRLEERLPFFAVRPPSRDDWLKKTGGKLPNATEFLQTLISNSGRLTSPYDTFETLRDVLSLGRLGNFADKPVSDFGISLLRKIPANRSCEQAGVPSQYCACDAEEPLEVSSSLVHAAAVAAVDRVNSLIETGLGHVSNRCASLRLRRIHDAREIFSSQATMSSGSNKVVVPVSYLNSNASVPSPKETGAVRRLRVTIEVDPSAAMFEATLVVDIGGTSFHVFEDISRINKYGNQSACIEHDILRKYCYCVKPS